MSDCVLSVAVPTYNEAENLPVLVERLESALSGIPHEVIVADDDSPDGTWETAGRLAERFPSVRCLRRKEDRGLYPAVMDAFAASRGEYLALMDADLQHDEGKLPEMLEAMRSRGLSLVVGSRHVPGGGIEGWSAARRLISRASGALANSVLRVRLRDPMSGFFMIERRTYEELAPRLRPKGFKVLVDILQNLPEGAAVEELGYVFRTRQAGKSKLGLKVALQFFAALAEAAAARLRR